MGELPDHDGYELAQRQHSPAYTVHENRELLLHALQDDSLNLPDQGLLAVDAVIDRADGNAGATAHRGEGQPAEAAFLDHLDRRLDHAIVGFLAAPLFWGACVRGIQSRLR